MQDSTRYVHKWLKDVTNLTLQQDAYCTTLDACFPDSAAWGRRFAENGQGKLKLKALFQELQYKEPPEFGSMRTTQLA